jgi:hypothetical protein
MKRILAALAAAALCSGIAAAQQGAMAGPPPPPEKGSVSSLISEATTQYEQIKKIITASAEKMPAENFSFKPTPEVRSYAELFTHVAQAQMGICGGIGGTARGRMEPVSASSKDDVIAALKRSFDVCDSANATVTEANAMEVSGQGFLRGSKLGLIYKNIAHDNEMYGTMVAYMRLKGIVPPSTAMRDRM